MTLPKWSDRLLLAVSGEGRDVRHRHKRARPEWWPAFSSPMRSTAVTARVGRLLGISFSICFVTGLLSHYQYQPWSWLPEPASPVWAYRVTQGLHVATGTASIPLLLVKLWSVLAGLTVAASVGLFFGVYPARRAAQLDPIAALRHEL